MATYGRITQGASWLEFEFRRRSRKITVTTSETMSRIVGYVRTQGSAANGTRAALVDATTHAVAYQSDVLAGFTDTTGTWREWAISGTVAPGDYWLVIASDGISGGGNTIQVAYDEAGSDSSLYQSWFTDGEATWPNLGSFVGNDDGDAGHTQNISLYLETASDEGQEADGSGAFDADLVITQDGDGQVALRKLLLTEAEGLELRDESSAPVANLTGIRFEWYDKITDTQGDPDVSGTFDTNSSGEAIIPLPGTGLSATDEGTLILEHPSDDEVRGIYRLPVS